MKKFLSMCLTAGLVLSNLTGCSSDSQETQTTTNSTTPTNTSVGSGDVVKVVATTFHEYDWIRQIIGEDNDSVELSLLLEDGVDLHSYQPTIEDIVTISSSDLFVHVGGISDSWVDGAVAEAVNENILVLNEITMLGDAVKMEESVNDVSSDHDHDHEEECTDENCEEDHDHDHEEECTDENCEEDHDHDHEEEEHDHEDDHDHEEEEHDHDHAEEEHDHEEEEHDHEEEAIPHGEEGHVHDETCTEEDHDHSHEDEHVWLSLKNAQEICKQLTVALSTLVPEQSDEFQSNLDLYLAALEELDQEYADVVNQSETKRILVADRFPFRYLVDDYNIEYHAAFSGCSAETEASFETIAYLAGKVDELNVQTILTIENANHNIAQTVISSSSAKNQAVLEMDSMQSTTLAAANSGTTYLSVMTSNLEVLKEALK